MKGRDETMETRRSRDEEEQGVQPDRHWRKQGESK